MTTTSPVSSPPNIPLCHLLATPALHSHFSSSTSHSTGGPGPRDDATTLKEVDDAFRSSSSWSSSSLSAPCPQVFLGSLPTCMPIFIALNCLISPILKGCGESKDDDGREKEVEDSGNTRHQDENGIYPEEELRTADPTSSSASVSASFPLIITSSRSRFHSRLIEENEEFLTRHGGDPEIASALKRVQFRHCSDPKDLLLLLSLLHTKIPTATDLNAALHTTDLSRESPNINSPTNPSRSHSNPTSESANLPPPAKLTNPFSSSQSRTNGSGARADDLEDFPSVIIAWDLFDLFLEERADSDSDSDSDSKSDVGEEGSNGGLGEEGETGKGEDESGSMGPRTPGVSRSPIHEGDGKSQHNHRTRAHKRKRGAGDDQGHDYKVGRNDHVQLKKGSTVHDYLSILASLRQFVDQISSQTGRTTPIPLILFEPQIDSSLMIPIHRDSSSSSSSSSSTVAQSEKTNNPTRGGGRFGQTPRKPPRVKYMTAKRAVEWSFGEGNVFMSVLETAVTPEVQQQFPRSRPPPPTKSPTINGPTNEPKTLNDPHEQEHKEDKDIHQHRQHRLINNHGHIIASFSSERRSPINEWSDVRCTRHTWGSRNA